jgi:hypothetical protein
MVSPSTTVAGPVTSANDGRATSVASKKAATVE